MGAKITMELASSMNNINEIVQGLVVVDMMPIDYLDIRHH
jgi:hypothetical protein